MHTRARLAPFQCFRMEALKPKCGESTARKDVQSMEFKKATRKQARLRMALIGPAGSGKTFTALKIAHYLGKRIAVLDTERGSASKYAGEVLPDGLQFDFD